MCWYFGMSLSEEMSKDAAEGEEPVPIGLIHSSIGGTTIQEWMLPGTTTNVNFACPANY